MRSPSLQPPHRAQETPSLPPLLIQPKLMQPQQNQTYLQKRAVVIEPQEKKAVALLQQIRALKD